MRVRWFSRSERCRQDHGAQNAFRAIESNVRRCAGAWLCPWERRHRKKRQFSLLMGQKNALWWDLPAQESLELNRAIYGIDSARFARVVNGLAELLEVEDKMNVMVRELSLGERMKMELISALIHEPRVLFLDEPTIGLDVVSQ